MDEGRVGDVVFIDRSTLLHEDLLSFGIWIKLPLTDVRAPTGTIVNGIPGVISPVEDSITINTVLVTYSNKTNLQSIADDINTADIPNVLASVSGGAIQIIETSSGPIEITTNTLGLESSPAVADMELPGAWCPLRVSAYPKYMAIQLSIESPIDKTYTLLDNAVFSFIVQFITAKTSSGTIDVSVQKNGVSIPGLNNVTVNDTRQTTKATSNIIARYGDTLTLITSNNSNAADLSVTIAYSYTNI